MKEGWVKPYNAKKWHYIVGYKSLCDSWSGVLLALIPDNERAEVSRHRDCEACKRLLKLKQEYERVSG